MHELQSQRQHLENELFGMLEDGVLSPEERDKVEALGKKLNISPQQLDTLIEKAKRESKDRNSKEHFVPPDILSANPRVAKAHFQILSDMAEVDRLVRSATDFDEHHHSLWNVLKRLEVGLPKEAQNDGKN
jgi:uncharacterized tellurite resistance protein B-like protein